jgi:hypothetical protein
MNIAAHAAVLNGCILVLQIARAHNELFDAYLPSPIAPLFDADQTIGVSFSSLIALKERLLGWLYCPERSA